eukprot:s5055_g7.t1
MVRTPEGYGLYDSTLRQPFNGAYILACADRVLKEKEEKDFKSRFARLSQIFVPTWTSRPSGKPNWRSSTHARPYEDIAVEEFLEKLPSPQVEEILEPEKDTPMDASEVNDEMAGKASSPQEEEAMPDISPHTEDEGELHDQGIWG